MSLVSCGARQGLAERAAAWRHDVGWLSVLAFLLQILLTTASFHIDAATGWSGPSIPLCLAHGVAADDGGQPLPSGSPLHPAPLQHPDCPICQTAAAVSASLAPATVEVVPLPPAGASPPPAAFVEAPRPPLSSQVQPRAPPNRA